MSESPSESMSVKGMLSAAPAHAFPKRTEYEDALANAEGVLRTSRS